MSSCLLLKKKKRTVRITLSLELGKRTIESILEPSFGPKVKKYHDALKRNVDEREAEARDFGSYFGSPPILYLSHGPFCFG